MAETLTQSSGNGGMDAINFETTFGDGGKLRSVNYEAFGLFRALTGRIVELGSLPPLDDPVRAEKLGADAIKLGQFTDYQPKA